MKKVKCEYLIEIVKKKKILIEKQKSGKLMRL